MFSNLAHDALRVISKFYLNFFHFPPEHNKLVWIRTGNGWEWIVNDSQTCVKYLTMSAWTKEREICWDLLKSAAAQRNLID